MADNLELADALEAPDRKELLEQQFTEMEQAEPEAAEAKPALERPRAPDGKFAPLAPQGKASAAPLEPSAEPLWKRPPASWKKDYHEVWATADDKLKEYAHQREEQMKAGVQPLMEKAKFADEVQQVVAPYMNIIRGLGATPVTAIKALMGADYTLRTGTPQEKLALFQRLAQQYGVSFNGAEMPQVDPNQNALAQQLNQLRGEWAGWQEKQRETQTTAVVSKIEKFAETHEHFSAVEDKMVQLIQSGIITGENEEAKLQNAYDKAIRLDDGLFEQMQTARQAEAQKNTVALKNEAAKKARSAAVSVKSSTPGTHTTPKAQNRREMLSEAFDNVDSRL
jgi:hypothetical protein